MPLDDRFEHQKIDAKWQARWMSEQRYRTPDPGKNKKYVLDMFPYPSGEGLHVGHPLGYIGTDIVARYFRSNGQSVLHPMGFDAFGLPAENYAIKTGTHPIITTQKAIERYRQQLQMIGLSYDWEREINTSDSNYYRWTQWLFLKLFEKGLAYRAKAPVNWCPHCQTVLANEQVVTRRIANSDKRLGERTDNFCERCDTPVIQKELEQWFFKITQYADELLVDIEKLDWPEPIKIMQRNWIGRSEGAEIEFSIRHSRFPIRVFTTRPDTLFGATYLVLAPEHPFIAEQIRNSKSEIRNKDEIKKYINLTTGKTELARTSEDSNEKTGVELKGVTAVNPATQEEIPIWVADYVLGSYGTGAIMAVPAHDQRDWEFARQFNLPIRTVIETNPVKNHHDNSTASMPATALEKPGELINSGSWTGWHSERDRDKIIDWLKTQGIGQRKTTYRLRDWLVSRQRYWGAPIPVIYCDKCPRQKTGDRRQETELKIATIDGINYSIYPVPDDQLPVRLSTDVDFKPTGQSPLVDSKTFHAGVVCPKCGQAARREVDTMDTFVDSAWYFLRFADPHNDQMAFDQKKIAKWLPVDWYVGGAEHAVLHLLYARFITKALADLDLINFREPFLRLRNQGLIGGEDGRKMSKRWGNVINPDEMVATHGADALRCFEMFMGPFAEAKPWSIQGIVGVRRWLERVWRIQTRITNDELRMTNEINRVLHQTIQKVTADIEKFHFNTAVSQLMILTNLLEKEPRPDAPTWQIFLKLLTPFAPHISHELWERANFKDYPDEAWPTVDKNQLMAVSVVVAVQVNGKLRGQLNSAADTDRAALVAAAQALPGVAKYLTDKTIHKTIIVPGRIVNFVVT